MQIFWDPSWQDATQTVGDTLIYTHIPLIPRVLSINSGEIRSDAIAYNVKKFILISTSNNTNKYSVATYVFEDDNSATDSSKTLNTANFDNFDGNLYLREFENKYSYKFKYSKGHNQNDATKLATNEIKSSNSHPSVKWIDVNCYDEYQCQWGGYCPGNFQVYIYYSSGRYCSYPTYIPIDCYNPQFSWSLSTSSSYPVCVITEYPDPPFPGAPTPPALQPLNLTRITANWQNVPVQIRTYLNSAYNELATYCTGRSVLQQLQNKYVRINFNSIRGTEPGRPGPPKNYPMMSYTPVTSGSSTPSIGYNQKDAATGITAPAFWEELFHAYQDKHYSGGLIQYNTTGKSNVEFEAKLLRDINTYIDGRAGVFAINGNAEYLTWLDEITGGGETYPTAYSEIANKYFYFMEMFKSTNPLYNYPIVPTLQPTAMFEIINTSNCKK